MNKQMTFTEILDSEFRYLIEALEWGSSDPAVTEALKTELLAKTGYFYID